MHELPGSKFIRWRNRQLEVTNDQGVWVNYKSHQIASMFVCSEESTTPSRGSGLLFSQGYAAMQRLLKLGYTYKQGDVSSLGDQD